MILFKRIQADAQELLDAASCQEGMSMASLADIESD